MLWSARFAKAASVSRATSAPRLGHVLRCSADRFILAAGNPFLSEALSDLRDSFFQVSSDAGRCRCAGNTTA